MEMIDDSKRLLWREAPGEQMRSQISSLSLSHSLSLSWSLSSPPLSTPYTNSSATHTHKQCVVKHFYHFSPFHLLGVSKRGREKKVQGKKRHAQSLIIQGNWEYMNCYPVDE